MRTGITMAVVLAAIFGVVAIIVCPTATPAQDEAQNRVKWEYKIVKVSATPGHVKNTFSPGVIKDDDLTALGEQGWELDKITGGLPFVSSFRVITPPATVLGGPYTSNTIGYTDTVYYFKRPK